MQKMPGQTCEQGYYLPSNHASVPQEQVECHNILSTILDDRQSCRDLCITSVYPEIMAQATEITCLVPSIFSVHM